MSAECGVLSTQFDLQQRKILIDQENMLLTIRIVRGQNRPFHRLQKQHNFKLCEKSFKLLSGTPWL